MEESLDPRNRDRIKIEWNNLGQLAVKLPPEIQHKNVNKCIDLESLLEDKGDLYEDVNVKRDTLAKVFEQ